MKDLNTKKRKKMLKNLKHLKTNGQERSFPIAWKVNEAKRDTDIKPGGLLKTFTSEEVGLLLTGAMGVKPTENRRFKVTYEIKSCADDNTITVTELIKKDAAQDPKRELNFAEAMFAFLIAVFIGAVIVNTVVLIQKIKVEKLATCELRGDCVELIRKANN